MKPLTDQQIRAAKPKLSSVGKPVKYDLVDASRQRGVGRLVLRVSSSATKEFAYRYKFNQKTRYIKVGRYPEISLSKAREAIIPFCDFLQKGLDPKLEIEKQEIERQAKEKAKLEQGNIKQLFHAYTDKMKRDGKRTFKAVLYSLEKEVYSTIAPETKASDVTRVQIKRVIANLIQRGASTQSNRVRSYLMAAFNYGLEHDNDPATLVQELNFGIEHNPVFGIPKQKNAEKVGNVYLTLKETHHLLNSFRQTPRVGFMCDALLFLCFHTGGQRPYELISSKWESVNWTAKTLLITPEISKNKQAHIVPLSESAIKILNNIQQVSSNSEYIFQQAKNKNEHLRTDSFSKSIRRYRLANKDFKCFVARDIRRTCKTLMGEIGISKEIRDRLQNHALNDVSSKHYDRYDYLVEKRTAIITWEKQLLLGKKTI